MSKQGIYKISGNTKPKVGEQVTYRIDEWYPATPLAKRNPALVTWHLFKKVNGKFVPTNIKKVGVSSFTFNTNAYKDTFRIEAYLHNPEERAPMALEVQPQPSDVPRINKVELKYIDDTPGTVFNFTEKLIAEASCMNLEGQYLMFTLWEDDFRDSGHNNSNQSIENKRAKVINGTARAEFMLTKALMRKAMEGETDPQQLEFYVTVEYYSHKKHATNNVNVNTPGELRTPSGPPQPQQPAPQQPKPAQPQPQQPAPPPAQPEPEPQSAPGSAHNTQPPTPAAPGGVSPSTVDPVKIEELLDAYFAKKEYIKETGEEDGTHTYTFGGSKSGNKTSTAEEKNKVAQTILGKIKESLKAQKKYTTLEVIAAALTAESYGKDTTNQKTVTFKTFKLGVDYKKVDSAPLDSKLYLVARTMLLDGKQVTISIKEKDGLIKGAPDAVLPVLEITEEQMDQKTPAGQAVPGTEKTVFTGTVQNNLVKIPIHLRPKSEEDLKQWRDKLSKGKEDGTYTYTFGGATNITNEAQKASIAKTILSNAQKGNAKNTKIENGKTSSEEEIKKVLEIKNYSEGNTITFKLLKKVPEFLYLHSKAQGTKQHNKKFLNKEGAYFQIGKKCDCEPKVRAFMRMLRVKEGSEGESGYTKLFGHGNFTKPPHNKDMSTHPKIVITAGGYSSSAAGAYQIMQDTYKGFQGYYQDKQKNWHYSEEINYIKKYKISSFDQESQDKLCLVIFKHNYLKKRANSFFYKEDGTPRSGRSKFNDAYGDIIQMIIDDNFDKAILTSSLCWASLPGAPYGQPTGTKEECKANYEKFLKEEIAGKSDLHLKEGFLKEFGYTCCDGNNESNGVCPDDCSQCFDYADVWENPEISTDNGGKNNNRFGYNSARGHKGIDIVSGPEYKDVHSLMCGEIVAIVDTFKTNQYKFRSLGNTLMIKSKDKDGKTVFILYCHLNKIYVKKGDKVKHGQKVAQSGSTGNASSDEFPNGVKGSGINKRYWHCHIEAATKGEGYSNFRDLGAYRIKAEDYMKTKFDKNGNTIK